MAQPRLHGAASIAILVSYLMRRESANAAASCVAHFLVSVPREVNYQRRQRCNVKGT